MIRKVFDGLNRVLPVLAEPSAIKAMATWPVFSFTSFLMLSRLVKLGLHPQTIVDVGANRGQFAVSATRLYPAAAVHSYEPAPDVFASLQKNTRGCSKIDARQLALGSTEGTLDFHLNSHPHSSSALPLASSHKDAFPDARELETIKVPVKTLDSVYSGVSLSGPVLLKLDVQGYESEVLKGGVAFLRSVDYLLIEMSFQPLYVGEPVLLEMLNLLDGLGFSLSQPVGFLSDPKSGQFLQMDGLFFRRPDSHR